MRLHFRVILTGVILQFGLVVKRITLMIVMLIL